MLRKFFTFSASLIVGLSITATMLSSCGGGEETEAGVKDFEVTTDTIKSQVRINFDMLRVNIPTPGKLSEQLKTSEIKYNKGFLLSTSKGGSFSSNYQKALGLGAFGADLSVAAAYNQSSDALEYLTQIAKLADGLGIGSAFDQEFNKELIASVGKKDTFQIMLDKSFDKAEKNLRSNERVALSVLMVSGGWIESLYTTIESLNTNPNGKEAHKIFKDVSAHCYAFEYVYQLLDEYKSNADCAKLAQELEPFKPALASFSKNSNLGPNDLPKLRETITQLRTKVIG